MRILSSFLALALVAGCTAPVARGINDPMEATNRQVHAFNTGLAGAVSSGGGKRGPVANELLITASNFTGNLSLPGKVLNSVLQGRPEPAVKNSFRFLINSTIGVGGLFDPASSDFALPETDTDFGETLHVWGVGEGPFVMLPVLGPSTARDSAGKLVDLVINPTGSWFTEEQKWGLRGLKVISKLGEAGQFSGTMDSILEDSADSYAQLRLIYLQKRRYELGQTTEDDFYDPYADQ